VTHFEFLSIAVSIVLGLSIARLLEGLRDTFDSTRRYWIHAVWVVGKLINALIIFWGTWMIRDEVETWNFAQFVISLGPPGIIYLQAHTLVTAHPDQVTDWRRHFCQIRRWLFGANALLPLYNAFALYVLAGREFPSAELGPLIAVLLLSVLGFAYSNERLHGAIAILYFVSLSVGFGTLWVIRT
jgi:hypothetical protein